MFNFRNNRPKSVIDSIKYSMIDQSNHRKVLIIGNGESGFLTFNHLYKFPPLGASDVGLVATNGVQRTRHGLLLRAVDHYCYLDYERTLIDKYPMVHFKFDRVLGLDLPASAVDFGNGIRLTYDYLVLAIGAGIPSPKWETNLELSLDNINTYNFNYPCEYSRLCDFLPELKSTRRYVSFVGNNSDQVQNLVSWALIAKYKNPKSKVELLFESSKLIIKNASELANTVLLNILSEKGIETHFQSTLENDGKQLLLNNEQISSDTLLVYGEALTQNKLFVNSKLQNNDFGIHNGQHSKYNNLFALGSCIKSNTDLYTKHRQAAKVSQSLITQLNNDWERKQDQVVDLLNKEKKEPTAMFLTETGKYFHLGLESGTVYQPSWYSRFRFFNFDQPVYLHFSWLSLLRKRLFK